MRVLSSSCLWMRSEWNLSGWKGAIALLAITGMIVACGDSGSPGAQISIIDTYGGDTAPPPGDVVTPDTTVTPDTDEDAGPIIECSNDLDCVLAYGAVGACQQPHCRAEDQLCELLAKESCCETKDDCDDNDPCTDDLCPQAGGSCEYAPRPTECAADADCGESNACVTVQCVGECGVCESIETPDCCLEDNDCDDDNACTADNCNSDNQCASAETACDDGNACTTDSCDPSEGCTTEAIQCNDDDPCTADTCNTDTGCVFEPIANCGGCANDAACEDGNACTIDTCGDNGICATADVVCADDDPCTKDSCDPDSGCVFEPIPGCGGCTNNAACDDNDSCTKDKCLDDGSCLSEAIAGCCKADNDCDDGDLCTADSCLGGECVAVTKSDCCTADLQCVDADPCTEDTCVNNSCVHEATENCCATDQQCDDGDSCTDDSCFGGQCLHVSTGLCCEGDQDCNDGDECTLDSCIFGQCVTVANPDCCTVDSDCATGDPCVKGTCLFGECIQSTMVECCSADTDCDDGNVCTIDVCASNLCGYEEKNDCCNEDADCNDGNDCTTNTCLFGECISQGNEDCCATDSDCNDDDACTQDTCLFDECVYAAKPGCCTSNAQCDDGNECTTNTCDINGQCQTQAVANCCTPSDGEPIMQLAFVPGVVDGWDPDPGNGPYRWRETTSNAFKGAGSMYFGSWDGDHYCSWQSWASAPSGVGVIPVESNPFPDGAISIPAGTSAWATFYLWLDMRSNPDVDQLSLDVLFDGNAETVWDKTSVPVTQYKSWIPVQVNLKKYAGKTVQLRFNFDVVDMDTDGGCFDAGTGPHVDEVAIVVADCSKECSGNDDCTSPPNGCFQKQGSCSDGACSYEPTGLCCETTADCNDDDVCTTDACIVGTCQHQVILGCCKANADCESGNSCVSSKCDLTANSCQYEFQDGPGCCVTAADCETVEGYCATEASCQENHCIVTEPNQSQDLMSFVFTDEIDGWKAGMGGDYHWRESDKETKSGPLALYFGDEDGENYCGGGGFGGNNWGLGGVANLPGEPPNEVYPTGAISFDATGKTTLTFSVYADIRQNNNVDELAVQLQRTDGAVIPVWTKVELAEDQYKTWVDVSVDVTSLAPFEGRVRVAFEVGNPSWFGGCGDGIGPFLDDFKVQQSCGD